MSVHYKFKSALSFDTITFDGLHISVRDLKKSILQQKQIGKATDFDLQITNAQSNEVYTDDSTLIPKNSSLIVVRIPLTAQQKKAWDKSDSSQVSGGKQANLDGQDPVATRLAKTVDLASVDASEEDKIQAAITQSTLDYDPSNYVRIKGSNQVGDLPPSYRCYKCLQPGHWIKDCKLNSQQDAIEIKKSTGIPRSFMVPVEGPSVPGAMMTPTGQYAVPSIEHEARKEPPRKPLDPSTIEKPSIPQDLVCGVCKDLLSDAVMIPCCGNSFCDECIRNVLLESEDHQCPDCKEKDVSPDTLIPNRFLRNWVNNFRNQTGYIKVAGAQQQPVQQAQQPSVQQTQPQLPVVEEAVVLPPDVTATESTTTTPVQQPQRPAPPQLPIVPTGAPPTVLAVDDGKKKPEQEATGAVGGGVVTTLSTKVTTIPTIGGKQSSHHHHHPSHHHINSGGGAGKPSVVMVGGRGVVSNSVRGGVAGLPIRNIAVHATRVANQQQLPILPTKTLDDPPTGGRRGDKTSYSHSSSHQDRSGTPTIDERNLSSEPPQGFQIQTLAHQPRMVLPMTHPPPYSTGNSYMYQPPSYHIPPPRDIGAYPPGVDDPRNHQYRGTGHHQHHYHQPLSSRPRPRLPTMYRGHSPLNGAIPSGPVDDPVVMFENLMKDKKARRLRMRRMRSRSPSRSYSRSLSRSPGSRSPRSLRSRSPRSRSPRSPRSRTRTRSPRSRTPPLPSHSHSHKRRPPLTSGQSRSRTRSRSNSLSRSPSRSQRSRSGSRSSVSRDRKFSPGQSRRRGDSRYKSPPHHQQPMSSSLYSSHHRSHNSPPRSPSRYYSQKYMKECESRSSQGSSSYRTGGGPDRRGRSGRQEYYASSSSSKAEYSRFNDKYESRHSARDRSYKRYDDYVDDYTEIVAKDWERIRDREIEQREREKQYEYYSLGGTGTGSSSRDRRSDSPPRDRHKRRGGQDTSGSGVQVSSSSSSSVKHHHHHTQPPPSTSNASSVTHQASTEVADTKEPPAAAVASQPPSTTQEDAVSSSRVLVDLKREPSREKTKTPEDKDKKTKERKKKKKEDTEKKRKKKEKKVKDKKDNLPDSTQPVDAVDKEADTKPSAEEVLQKDDLYGGLEANIDQSVVENYSKIVTEPQPGPSKDVMLAPVPELSKWEKDDEIPGGGLAQDVKTEEKPAVTPPEECKQVTSEVLKRAENAIFKKAINPLKPVEPKKVLMEVPKKKDERHAPKSVALPVRPQQQAPPPASAPDDRRRHQKPSPVRISAKERLGAKIDDKIVVKHSLKLSKREIKIEKLPPKSVVRKERSDNHHPDSSRKSSREEPKKCAPNKKLIVGSLDEFNFEPDYETSDHESHHHHSEKKSKKRSQSPSRTEKPQQPTKKAKIEEGETPSASTVSGLKPPPIVTQPSPPPAQEQHSSEDSTGASTDESEGGDRKHKRSRKKSKKRKRSKKHSKRKHDSSSESDSSSSSSGSETEKKKRRHKHKSHKKSKKRKKSKK